MKRRDFLKTAAAVSLSSVAQGCGNSAYWDRDAYRKSRASRVAILRAENYQARLADIIFRGIKVCGLQVRGRKVLLKPNLVEFDANGVINTHPAVVEAAIHAFRSLGADVLVGDGPGHRRDNEYLLRSSGLYDVLREHHVQYVDLNSDDVEPTRLRSRFTTFRQFYFPRSVLHADLVVSMPKLKTHHWAGITVSLKNMFGIIPGSVYGWPKNALHWAGIHGSIVDINASLRVPQFAIVDGIVGMEGNGPIQGTAKRTGVLIFGHDLVAVDATAARIMQIEPRKVKYLALAGGFLGNLDDDTIEQIGEPWEKLKHNFQVIDDFKEIKSLIG